MSAFDFFFPEQAQASHLRSLVRQKQFEYSNDQRENKDLREELKYSAKVIQKISKELAETQLIVKSMMELIEEAGVCSSEQIWDKMREVDLRDGVEDGQITPASQRPKPKFEAKRSWKD